MKQKVEVRRKQEDINWEEKNQQAVRNLPDCDSEVSLTFATLVNALCK